MTCRNSSGVSRVAGTAVPTPGVIDENVYPTELVDRTADEFPAVVRASDVRPHADRTPTGLLNRALGGLQPIDTPRPESNVRTCFRKSLRDGGAET